MRRISVQQLNEWITKEKEIQIIDIRDAAEVEIALLPHAINIPKHEIQERYTEISPDIPVIIVCRFGTNSASTIRYLVSKGYDANQLIILDGGIFEWAQEIDPSMPAHLL